MGWRSDLRFLALFSAGNPAERGRDELSQEPSVSREAVRDLCASGLSGWLLPLRCPPFMKVANLSRKAA